MEGGGTKAGGNNPLWNGPRGPVNLGSSPAPAPAIAEPSCYFTPIPRETTAQDRGNRGQAGGGPEQRRMKTQSKIAGMDGRTPKNHEQQCNEEARLTCRVDPCPGPEGRGLGVCNPKHRQMILHGLRT